MNAITPAARIPGLSKARLKRIVAAGNVAAFAVGLWTLIFATRFYWLSLALCLLLPLGALALDLWTKGALSFEERRSRRYPLSLATILVIPSIALGCRAINDLNFESHNLLIAETAVAVAAILWLFLRLSPLLKDDFNQLTSIAIFALAWSYGAIAFTDVLLDPARGQDTSTVIRDKRVHVSGGVKGSSIWRSVSVGSDASPGGVKWIEMRPDLFETFHRGDAVCLHVGPGLLGATWYDVRRCP